MIQSHHRQAHSLTTCCVTLLVAGCCCLAPKKPNGDLATGVGPLQAAAAKVEIAFDPGTPLAGYGGSPRREINIATLPANLLALGGLCSDPDPSTAATLFAPATGQHDAISARALVLDNGIRKLALIKFDTVGVTRRLRDDLFATAKPLGVAYRDFVVVASHTHSGPGALAEDPLLQVTGADCLAGSVHAKLVAAGAQALNEANTGLTTARLGIATTTVSGANRNRRGRPAIVDPTLAIIKIVATGGTPIAALFNFAVHGTSLGQANMKFSADCMGAMEDEVESGLPGSVAIFTNGAEGDVAPQHSGLAGMQTMATLVGGAVVGQWNSIATKGAVDLRGAIADVDMPAPRFNLDGSGACFPVPGTSNDICSLLNIQTTLPLPPHWLPSTLPFQALRIGDTVLVAIPGEAITEIGWQIGQEAGARGFTRALVLGLANDHGGYFTTEQEYLRAEYEGRATAYGPSTGAVVVQSAAGVIDQVQ